MTITLRQLVEGARATLERDRARCPDPELQARLRDREGEAGAAQRLRRALGGPRLDVIAEIKGASPLAGTLQASLEPAALARAYCEAGAAAVSVLTEERHFAGHLDHLRAAAAAVTQPVLRKDFIIDPYQIRQAALAGAAAVLLIAEALSAEQLQDLVGVAHELHLDALVEVHATTSLAAAVASGSGLVGVNNRNLETMEVDWHHCLNIAADLPDDVIRVAESGLGRARQLRQVHAAGYDAVLIGTALVSASEPGTALRRLRSEVA